VKPLDSCDVADFYGLTGTVFQTAERVAEAGPGSRLVALRGDRGARTCRRGRRTRAARNGWCRGGTGPQGPKGDAGAQGACGRDGAAVVARVRSAGSVDTSEGGTVVAVPLVGNTWSQEANEVDLLPDGLVTYVAPATDGCAGSGPVILTIELDVGGLRSYAQPTVLFDGGTHVARMPEPEYQFEPGMATSRTATVIASSNCLNAALHPKITISSVRFDVIRAS
jgi:hypothetical protein